MPDQPDQHDMTSKKPYLIRAFYEWILDNDVTPYLLIDATMEGVEVPDDYVGDGRIVLNVSPGAIKNLVVDNESVHFDARFAGVPWQVVAPVRAVLAIYAHESGQGMAFDEDEDDDDIPPSLPRQSKNIASKKAQTKLRIVKSPKKKED